MKIHEDGRIQCRCKIIGSYQGKPFEYVDPVESDGCYFLWPDSDPSTYWWAEGDMACDCNRGHFVGLDLNCGDEVLIDEIIPIGENLLLNMKTLVLNETRNGKA